MTCQKHGHQETWLIEERKKSNIFPQSKSQLQKSWKLGFYNPLPFISQFPSSNWAPIFDQTGWMHWLFAKSKIHQKFKDRWARKIQTLNAFFLRMHTNNAKICDVWSKMCFTYVVYVCSDISLYECYLGSMERWGGKASKTELKDMFQLSNDKRNVS